VSSADDHLIPLVDEGLGNAAYLGGLTLRALATPGHTSFVGDMGTGRDSNRANDEWSVLADGTRRAG
jgi:hypothetical protein